MEIDLTPTQTPTPTPTTTKSQDDTELDTPPHTSKPLSFTNGALNHHHQPPPLPPPIEVTYKECMKNHAAAIGGHAVDGCGEFMPSPSTTTTTSAAVDPTLLTCAACGCHRNFHRRDPESPTAAAITPPFLDFRHPPLPKRFSLSPSPPRPRVPRAPHVFFGLSAAEEHHPAPVTPTVENTLGRKRFRTKFSQNQKEKMRCFAMKLGWKMHKCDEAVVKQFCQEIGVSKGVLKVWMHNNKTTSAKKESSGGGGGDGSGGGGALSFENSGSGGSGGSGGEERNKIDNINGNGNGNGNLFKNGSGINGIHYHASSSSPP